MKVASVFIIAVLPFSIVLAQVSVQPNNFYVSFSGGSASFLCFCTGHCPSTANAMWLINDTLLENPESINAELDSIGGRGRLRLFNISPSFNTTLIRCRVELQSGEIEISRNGTLLLLQGNLSVGSLTVETQDLEITITWTAPFTLLPDPDITYCLEVGNATSLMVLHSECGISETRFIYPVPFDINCHRFYFTVVPNGRIGHPNAVTTTLQALETVPELGPEGFTTLRSCTCRIIIVELSMTAPVCTAHLTCMDLNTGEILPLTHDSLVSIENSTIVFSTEELTANRHYSIMIEARNVAGSAMSQTILSTHVISDFAIVMEGHNITITISYEDSGARGALLSFTHMNNNGAIDFSRSTIFSINTCASSTICNHTLPFGLPAGVYQVLAYDTDKYGTLPSGTSYPAASHEFETSGNTKENLKPLFLLLENCSVNIFIHLISVECTYPLHTTVAGFQVIARAPDYSQTHKLYSSKAESPQRQVVIPVQENGLYQVTVLGIRQGSLSNVEYVEMLTVNDSMITDTCMLSTSNTGTVITGMGIGFGILMFIIIILCGVIIVMIQKATTKKVTIVKNETKVGLNSEHSEDANIHTENQLYAEIKDLNRDSAPVPYAECVADPTPSTKTAAPTSHHYDEVVLDNRKPSGDYQLTVCEAYGVH